MGAAVERPHASLAEKEMTMVVDGLLCGLVGKIVARLEENCKRLLGDGFDRAGVGRGLW